MNKLIAALILFIIFVSAAYSQSVRTLTLYDAINLAKRNNSDYVIAKLDKLKAEKQVSEVYSENLLPTITLNSRFQRAIRKQVFDIFGQLRSIRIDSLLFNY